MTLEISEEVKAKIYNLCAKHGTKTPAELVAVALGTLDFMHEIREEGCSIIIRDLDGKDEEFPRL